MNEFETRCHEIDRLITANKFYGKKGALALAIKLYEDFKGRAQAAFMLALCFEMTGSSDRAEIIRGWARNCDDYSPHWEGDLGRDALLGMIRRGEEIPDFDVRINTIRYLHRDDNDRLACLLMVEARYLYSQGKYEQAATMHWRAASLLKNEQWRFNNLLPELKAKTMRGFGRTVCREMFRDIANKCPQRNSKTPKGDYLGTRKILWRARLVKTGKLGCRLDDLLELLYWRHIVKLR